MMPHPENRLDRLGASGARSRLGLVRLPGRFRFALWSAVLAASSGFVLVAASENRPVVPVVLPALPPLTSESKTDTYKTSARLANLASFQRRGTSLVGEVTTREGAVMRLVFDARTHALIGLRVLDPPEARPGEPEAARGCVDQSSIAPLLPSPPLPNGVAPAN